MSSFHPPSTQSLSTEMLGYSQMSVPLQNYPRLPRLPQSGHHPLVGGPTASCSSAIFFFYGCVGSSFLCEGFLQLRQAGATLHRDARASRYRGLSCCGAQAPDAQAQQPWLTGPAAPRHAGSSQARARTRVPCLGRRILNLCATREALVLLFFKNSSLQVDGMLPEDREYTDSSLGITESITLLCHRLYRKCWFN